VCRTERRGGGRLPCAARWGGSGARASGRSEGAVPGLALSPRRGSASGSRWPSCSRASPAAGREPAAGADELEQLRALGYVDFAEDAAPVAQSGVVRHDAARSAPGYSLYASRPLRRAELIDAQGRSLRTWQGAGPGHWSHVLLLEDGDLLVVGSGSEKPEGGRIDDEARYLERRSFGRRALAPRAPSAPRREPRADGRFMVLVSKDRRIRDRRRGRGATRASRS
jgi:hypothetical protein